MNQIPIKSTINTCGGEGVLSTGKIFILARRDHPLLIRCIARDGKGRCQIWWDFEKNHQWDSNLLDNAYTVLF